MRKNSRSSAGIRVCFTLLFCLCTFTSFLQPARYTTSNAHSHNDYEQDRPFEKAYDAGFGSIEADVFLVGDQLLVGHDSEYLHPARRLDNLYLEPIRTLIEKNGGSCYADTARQLQLMIDLKTDSLLTINKLIELLKDYPSLTGARSLRIVITGNRPPASLFSSYPPFIWFDGLPGKYYVQAQLDRIALFSADFKNYARWKGIGQPNQPEWQRLKATVNLAHRLKKPIRFWGAPDLINAWTRLVQLKVDYINTDHIPELAAFLNRCSRVPLINKP